MGISRALRFRYLRLVVAGSTMLIVPILGIFEGAPHATSSTLPAPSPVSVSFLSSGEGWALSTFHCTTGNCAEVNRTSNAGRSWTADPLPPQVQKIFRSSISIYQPFLTLSIYFADSHDGWIYGTLYRRTASTDTYSPPKTELWSTHDGGNSWKALNVATFGMKFGVLAVDAIAGQVYAVAWRTDHTFGLWRSPNSADSWQKVATPSLPTAAGGTSMEVALVFKGDGGWLMVGNDRGVTGSARLNSQGRWMKWKPPCFSVGNGFVVPVAYTATSLIDVCTIGGYGSDVAGNTPSYVKLGSNWIYSSNNGGATFNPTTRIVINTSFLSFSLSNGPVSPAPGVILVTTLVGSGKTVSGHLYSSRVGGRTWTLVYATPFSPVQQLIENPTFASSKLGSAIVQTSESAPSLLIISTDGGKTWHKSTV